MVDNFIFEGLSLVNVSEGWLVGTPVDGLDVPIYSMGSYPRSGEDGIVISSMYSRERRIIIPGLIQASCASELSEKRRLLAVRTMPDRDVNGSLQSKTLRIVRGSEDYTVFVQSSKLLMPATMPTSCQYQLDLIAEDPNIYSTSSKSGIATKSTGGSFSIPFSIPFSFVGGVDGSVAVTNSGDVSTFPTITLNGPLTNPRILNETTGRFIQINETINMGEYIIINTQNKTVLLNGSSNKIGSMTDNSDWIWISILILSVVRFSILISHLKRRVKSCRIK